MTEKATFRKRADQLFSSKYFFISVITLCLAFSIRWGAAGYYLGILVVILSLWANKWTIKSFGFKKNRGFRTVLSALGISALIFIGNDMLFQPFLESYLGPINIAALDPLKGNAPAYISTLFMMWIIAAFGEEMFYRGYLMKRFSELIGNRDESWFLGAVFSAVYFGLAHLYQGLSGVLLTGLIGLVFGLIFMRNRNLWLLVLIHGIYDTIGLTVIFLDKVEWVSELLFSA